MMVLGAVGVLLRRVRIQIILKLWMKLFDNVRYTRSGKELALLPSVEDSLPSVFMDGEFWY